MTHFNLHKLQKRLFEPVDIASIVIFRILFGAILVWEVIRYFEKDWIRLYYIVRDYYFKYFGFEWVHPWPGDGCISTSSRWAYSPSVL